MFSSRLLLLVALIVSATAFTKLPNQICTISLHAALQPPRSPSNPMRDFLNSLFKVFPEVLSPLKEPNYNAIINDMPK